MTRRSHALQGASSTATMSALLPRKGKPQIRGLRGFPGTAATASDRSCSKAVVVTERPIQQFCRRWIDEFASSDVVLHGDPSVGVTEQFGR